MTGSEHSTSEHRVQLGGAQRPVSALLRRPPEARWGLVLAHGAGAGMRHVFMEALTDRLADQGMATLRYQFPYMEVGKRRPDSPSLLVKTVRAAVDLAAELLDGLPLFAGGKSMGGRMTSTAASTEPLAASSGQEVRGIVFYGFPLHPAGRPATQRGDHLQQVEAPMLFLQGTRDKLGGLDLVEPLVQGLPRATLHVVDGADHSFKVLKRSGRTDDEVLDELAQSTVTWCEDQVP